MSRCFLAEKKKGEGEECSVQLFHYWGPFQYGEGGKYRNADIQKYRYTEIQEGNTGKGVQCVQVFHYWRPFQYGGERGYIAVSVE